ncbi:hypothetical protein NQ318_015989 [Aromia moschata]|uniref:Uncharacterized protein n=1 Tax=Aromia moschata TaxID=1265417 RepID=A0AAV8X1P4_9CUCU|nr:hypothetical protein NQ318_015989 [Aromia moschata]
MTIKKEDEDVFIPTHEWQSVKKGQKIPEGLHIRINLETGVTEAKLLDEKDKVNKDNALLEIPQKENQDLDDRLLQSDVIKETLKKLKGDDILKPEEISRDQEIS